MAWVPGLVSCVIPCYKGERWLARAIESCLAQTWPQVEVIVVDDCSPDGSAELAAAYATRDPRVRLVRREQNGGVARAFNSGYAVARGEFLTRLAQDDWYEPEAFATMAEALIADARLGLVYCDEQLVDDNGDLIRVRPAREPESALTPYDNAVGLCVMWRHSAWDETGEFDPAFDTAEDYEYWLRLTRRWPMAHRAGVAPFAFRFHEAMGSQVYQAKQEALVAQAWCRHRPTSIGERSRILNRGYLGASWYARHRGAWSEAFGWGLRSLAWRPWRAASWKNLVGIAAKAVRGPEAQPSARPAEPEPQVSELV